MFDGATRLVLCNDRYVEIYGLDPALAKPGVLLRDLLAQRKRTGTFAGEPERYIADTMRRMREAKAMLDVRELPDGRVISVSSRLMADGGWVATHQDVTERRRQDQERDRLVAHEQRRVMIDAAIAAFRQHAERMLSTVGEHAGSMRATATDAVLGVAPDLAARRGRGQRIERGVRQCRDRGVGRQRAVGVDRRDQPPARPDQPTSSASRSARRAAPTTRSARWPRPRRRSATWSSSFRTSPARPTCSRSTPPSRRRAPAKPAAASPWWPRR